MIEYCVSAFSQYQKELLYKVYVTDTLRHINEAVSRIDGGAYMSKRYYDIINPTQEEELSGDEIAMDIIKRAGLRIGGEPDGSNDTGGKTDTGFQ